MSESITNISVPTVDQEGEDESAKAKAQVMAELTTAKALLDDSETAEAAAFWTNYIDDLEGRLAALENGETIAYTNSYADVASVSGSLAPDSVAPGSVAPDSIAPGSIAPGSVAPGSIAPGSIAPGSVAPGSVAALSTGGSVVDSGSVMQTPESTQFATTSAATEQVGSTNVLETSAIGVENTRSSQQQEAIEDDKQSFPASTTPNGNLFNAPMVTRQPVNLDEIHRTNQNEILVDVVAPVDLPDGYTFEARMGEKRFMATVPPGGVSQGQTFQCPMKEVEKTEFDIPERHWRDGICDLFSEGICHPFLCNALFCPLIAVGQVATRLQLNWCGQSGNKVDAYAVQNNMLAMVVFWVVLNVIAIHYMLVQWVRGWFDYSDATPIIAINVFIYLLTVIVVTNTRKQVREKCEISDDCPGEDFCKTITCMPCTIAQMGRHTADYDSFPGYCCSKTGLPENVSIIAPSNARVSTYAPPVRASEAEMV